MNMLKRTALLLLTACASYLTTGFQQAPSQANWQEFSSKEGGFSLLVPGKPAEQTFPINSASGNTTFHTYAFIGVDGEIYIFAYFAALPGFDGSAKQIPEVLTIAQDFQAATIRGQVISEKDITLGEYPGCEIRLKTDTKGVTTRMFLVGKRLYLISVFVPDSKTKSDIVKKNTLKFLDSFKVTPL